MSRVAKIKAVWCEAENAYRVSVPPSLSSTGKRQIKSFAKKADAVTFAEQFKARRENYGSLAGTLSPADTAEAAECLKLLSGLNVSLLTAVKEYVEAHKLRSQSVSLEELFNQFITSRPTKPKREQELRQTLRKFDGELIVSDLTSQTIQTAFAGLTPASLESNLRKLSTVLSYGVTKGYLASNPVDKIDRPDLGIREVQVASSAIVRALFADALENDLEMIPFLVFTFFCGIRPGGEMNRLDWANVNCKEVVLRKTQTKTSMKRAIPLLDAAQAWLNLYVARGGVREGLVVKRTVSQIEDARRRNWKAAGFDTIPQDIARHSFCSHFLALTGDLTKSLLASGHTDPKIFWQHYYQHCTEEETKAFWAIMPPAEDSKIVSITAAA
jgi:integrase